MSNAFIDIMGIIPPQMVFAYALSKMLSIRHLPLYWAFEFGYTLFLACFRSGFGVEVRFIAALPLMIVPVVISSGGLARRTMAVVLAYLVLFFQELLYGAFWVAMTGAPIANYDAAREHFGAFLLTHAAHLVLEVPLLAMLCMLFNRFVDRGSDGGQGRETWLPVLFLGMQLMLVCFMTLLSLGYVEDPLRYYAGTVVLSFVGFAADALLFLSMNRYVLKRRDDARARMLKEQLGCYLTQYDDFVSAIERTAQLRHDMGNNVQVVLALACKGMFREAREHLGLVRGELADSRDEGVA